MIIIVQHSWEREEKCIYGKSAAIFYTADLRGYLIDYLLFKNDTTSQSQT